MRDIKHILLDLDGTLTDPKEGITKSVQYALEQMGVEPPHRDDLEWTIGPPLTYAFEKLLGTKDNRRVQQAIDFYRERYVERCAIENKPYAGIQNTLQQLKDDGFELYLATSKPWPYAGKILEHFDLQHYFDGIHGSELDGTRDYKEDLIAYILKQRNLNNEQTLMIGDRQYDIHGAKHNKVHSIGVTYGYGSLEEIKEANPDVICHEHPHIVTIVR